MKKLMALICVCSVVYVLLAMYIIGNEPLNISDRFLVAFFGIFIAVIIPVAIADCNNWLKQDKNHSK